MKNILLLLFLFVSLSGFGKLDTLNPETKITDVTVFFKGAEVNRNVQLTLNKGQHLLLFDQLPQEINPQSIQVKSQSNLQILSVVHQLNYKDQAKKSNTIPRIHFN